MSRARRILFGLTAAVLGGCGNDFAEPSELTELRVLAVEATPLEAGPGDEVTLRPLIYLPPGERLASGRWRFCPFTAGSATGYRCALPECETDLSVAADGTISANPFELARTCAANLGAESGGGGSLGSGALPSEIESVFLATHLSSSGLERQTALRFPLWLAGAPPTRNRAPAIQEVTLAGEPLTLGALARPAVAGSELELRAKIDPASLDAFVDAAGRQRSEEPVVSFYATAGRLSANADSGSDVQVKLQLPEEPPEEGQVLLYVVVRDGRGGQRGAGPFTVPISR